MSTSDASSELVLGLLSDALGEFLSGEVLSAKLGLAPTEVYRQIESLRAQGYRIDSRGRAGYRLVSVPDRLTPLEIEPFLTTHDLGRELHHRAVIDSTNALANILASEGAFHGEAVVAEHQSEGRGRRGRTWISPPEQNIYLSVILRPDLPALRAPELTFVAGVAIAESLRTAFNLPVDLKWPNDLLVNGLKLAGILTELSASGDRIGYVVLGLGLNVNMEAADFPAEIASTATSLRIELGQPLDRPLLCAALLSSLEVWYDRWLEEGFGPVREMWQALSATLQRPVRIHLGDDVQGFDGVAEGIDERGSLLVRRANGVLERVVAGEVVHLRPLKHSSSE
ncbi:MAG: biotin--[acetyl-CoA-carboxylase] ligase [Deltaproteobacteria bacterium]|nr:biotin--[acetyl-CoA-carboxylase] ligase [Deltaproteobacteria bacterium]